MVGQCEYEYMSWYVVYGSIGGERERERGGGRGGEREKEMERGMEGDGEVEG